MTVDERAVQLAEASRNVGQLLPPAVRNRSIVGVDADAATAVSPQRAARRPSAAFVATSPESPRDDGSGHVLVPPTTSQRHDGSTPRVGGAAPAEMAPRPVAREVPVRSQWQGPPSDAGGAPPAASERPPPERVSPLRTAAAGKFFSNNSLKTRTRKVKFLK